jgi:hypothetical protein
MAGQVLFAAVRLGFCDYPGQTLSVLQMNQPVAQKLTSYGDSVAIEKLPR